MQPTWNLIQTHGGEYAKAALLAVEVSVLAFILAFLLGLAGAAGRRSRLLPIRIVATTYVEVIRNTPVLLQVFVAYFALPSAGLPLSPFQAGVAALGVNVGAYLTEILRAGVEAVPRTQREAAQVLALSRVQTFRFVILPQALRNVYPAVVNQFIQILLGTSLLSAISLPELTGTAQSLNSQTLLTTQTFAVSLVIYLLLTNVVAVLASWYARVAFRPPLKTTIRPGRALRRREAAA